MLKYLSAKEVIENFGNFLPYLDIEGKPTIFWEEEILKSITLPAPLPLSWSPNIKVPVIKCHKKIAPFLIQALHECYNTFGVWNTINDYGGCYNFRVQRKANKTPSRHCWAIALDLDVRDNPFGKSSAVNPQTVKIFEENGFMWGGNFSAKRVDPMHFEFADLGRL
jgi:hypothetical protein